MRPCDSVPRLPLLLLAASVALSGCAGKRLQLFRGLERDLFDVHAESDLALASPAPQAAPQEPVWLSPTILTADGVSGRGAWSPDGAHIVFQSVRPGGLVPNPWEQTWIMGADGSAQRRVSMGVGKTHGPAWIPGTERSVAYASTHAGGLTPPRDTPGLHAGRDPAMDLYIQDLQDGSFAMLSGADGFDGEVVFCGRRFAHVGLRAGATTVVISSLDDPAVSQTLDAGPNPRWPRLSPDCGSVLWVVDTPDGSMVAVQSLDADLPTPLLGPLPSIGSADWIPGADAIVFASDVADPGGAHDLFRLGLDGDDLRRLTDGLRASHPRTSPDGTRLLFTVETPTGPQVATAPLTPGAVYVLPPGDAE